MLLADAPGVRSAPRQTGQGARKLYFSLYADPAAQPAHARAFVDEQIALARELPVDLPSNINDLQAWIEERTDIVGQEYREYLAARKNGAPRRYFSCRAHALYFIKGVAPTKLVDGAWLYGLVRQWDDVAFHPLIKTYL